MGARTKHFDENKYMLFLIEDDGLLETCNKILDKVSNSIKKYFDIKPVDNKKYLKTNIKSYEGNTNTDFRSKGVPKKGSHCICLSAIISDSVFKNGKNYYLKVYLKECKHFQRKKYETIY